MATKHLLLLLFPCAWLMITMACHPKREIVYGTDETATKTRRSKNTTSATTSYLMFKEGDFVPVILDSPSRPVGGEELFYRTMFRDMKYPPQARQRGVQGVVLITVIVDEWGQMESASVKQGIGAGCDEEALKAVRRGGQNGFEPALKDNQPVKIKYDIPVRFSVD